ncbi:membrane protein [Microbacterium phage Damascus]|nr:membrane protein [Microbacterium phage Damascus]
MDQFWLQFWAQVWEAVKYMALGAFVFWLFFSKAEVKTPPKPKEEKLIISSPHFESMNTGDIFSVSYQAWKISEIETEYDPATATHRLRVTAKSVGVGL